MKPRPLDLETIEWLNRFRKERNLTQEQLGSMIGIKSSTMRDILKGKNTSQEKHRRIKELIEKFSETPRGDLRIIPAELIGQELNDTLKKFLSLAAELAKRGEGTRERVRNIGNNRALLLQSFYASSALTSEGGMKKAREESNKGLKVTILEKGV